MTGLTPVDAAQVLVSADALPPTERKRHSSPSWGFLRPRANLIQAHGWTVPGVSGSGRGVKRRLIWNILYLLGAIIFLKTAPILDEIPRFGAVPAYCAPQIKTQLWDPCAVLVF